MKIQKDVLLGLKSFLLVFVSILFISACDNAKDTVEETADKAIDKSEELISEVAKKVEEVSDEVITEVVDNSFLLGNWTGKFDNRKAVMVITEQNENSFKGKITISYRQPINQEVTGSFNPETNKITMTDQLHSRYKGTYDGKLNEDKSGFSGQFTMKLDGKKFNFNLNKK